MPRKQVPSDSTAADERHPVTADVLGAPPASGSQRQQDYRRRRSTKSIDVTATTHDMLKQLCERDGLNVDAALRAALGAALGHDAADDRVLGAAWTYLEAVLASVETFSKTGKVTGKHTRPVAAAVAAFKATLDDSDTLSPEARRRAQWLSWQASERIDYVQANSNPVEPMVANARQGSIDTVAQTLLSGGAHSGTSLNSASLVLVPSEEDPE